MITPPLRSGFDRAKRYWLRLFQCCLFLGLLLLSGCDLSWNERANVAFEAALQFEGEGKYQEARAKYEEALHANPYHAKANRNLAELLEMRFFETALPRVYYQRYLSLRPKERSEEERIKAVMSLLELLEKGEWEDPVNAARDLVWAVKRDGRSFFDERLDLEEFHKRRKNPDALWQEWVKRLSGVEPKPVYRDISGRAGNARALVVLALYDKKGVLQEKRALHFTMGKNNLWRLRADRALEAAGK